MWTWPQDDVYMDYIKQGVLLSYEGNFENSVQWYNKAIRLRPGFWRAYFHRGNDFMNMRKKQRSRDDFNFILEKCRDSIDPVYDLVVRGCICELDKQDEDQQSKKKRNNNNNDQATATSTATATTAAVATGNYDSATSTAASTTTTCAAKAQDYYRQALALEPDNYHANYFLGYTLSEDKKYEESIPLFEKAATLAPISPCVAYSNIGYAYQQMTQYDKATEYYQKSLQAFPRCITAIHNIASIKSEVEGKHEEAIKIYMDNVDVNRNDILAELGYIYFAAEQNDKAQQCFDRLAKLNPYTEESYLFQYGLKLDEAVNYLQSYYMQHIELFDDPVFADAPTISKLPADIQETILNTIRQALKYLNDGIHNVFENDEIELLIESKQKAITSELPMILGLKQDKIAQLDSCPYNLKWTENRFRHAMKKQLYRFLLHANVGLENLDFKFYRYYFDNGQEASNRNNDDDDSIHVQAPKRQRLAKHVNSPKTQQHTRVGFDKVHDFTNVVIFTFKK